MCCSSLPLCKQHITASEQQAVASSSSHGLRAAAKAVLPLTAAARGLLLLTNCLITCWLPSHGNITEWILHSHVNSRTVGVRADLQ